MPVPLKILMVVTSHALMGATGHPTGVWFEELATPYYVFADAGAQVDVVSIAGGQVPLDPASAAGGHVPASVERFRADPVAMAKITHSPALATVSADGYDAVFLPGGHGTMWDLPDNPTLAGVLSRFWTSGKVVAAVCHGPAGLVGATDETGRPIVAGRHVAGFSNAEEKAAGWDRVVPFLLESKLRELGALYASGPDFQPFVQRDGKLVTGQNPASSELAARTTLDAIKD